MIIPAVLLAASVGAAIFTLTGCGGDDDPQGLPSSEQKDAGSKDDAATDAVAQTDASQDVAADALADAPPQDGAADSSDATSQPPPTPVAPGASMYADAPCAYPASLSVDPTANALLISCGGVMDGNGNMTNALFRSTSLGGGSISWNMAGEVGGYPSNHVSMDADHVAVSHTYPDGITIVRPSDGGMTETLDFISLPAVESLSFTPNNPVGMIRLGDANTAGALLCIATSNLDQIDPQNFENTTFFPSTVICLPYASDGSLQDDAASVVELPSINTTAMGLIDQAPDAQGKQRFAVLSANSYAPNSTTEAQLHRCEYPSMTCESTPLGTITAQNSPQLALTTGGLLVIGKQKPTNGFIAVNAITGAIVREEEMPEATNFISSINAYGEIATLADFGMANGAILYADLAPAGWQGHPKSALFGNPGPSVIVGDTLYAAAAAMEDGGTPVGRIMRFDLSSLAGNQ